MNRADVAAELYRLYALREAGDVDGLLAALAPSATYHIVGDQAHCPSAGAYSGAELRSALEAACRLFKAGTFDITSMVIDGDQAAVRVRVLLTFAPTGETVISELGHFWTLEDGRAVEIVEYHDSAMVAGLLRQVTPPAAQGEFVAMGTA